MKAKIHVQSPDFVNVTLTITMPLGRWKALRATTGSDTAVEEEFRAVIDSAIQRISAELDEDTELEP